MVSWEDLGKGLDKGIDLVDKGIDKGKELVGQGIDKGTDAVGWGLEKVGAEDWADSVEDWGDDTASSLGAEVGEQQLGQTEEPNELIHGKPAKISESVKNLRDFQKAFDLVGAGMKKLDSASWKGEAANAFRENFQTLPTDWLHAADAFENAAKALETYGTAVTTAQGKAREAIDLYKEAQADYKTAADAYNKKVDAYNGARNSDNPLPKPAEFTDPSQGKRQRAQEILKAARQARKEAADTAKAAVTAAMAHAPKEPTGREKATLELADYAFGQGVEMMHFGGGIVKGAAGLVNFVRSVNILDPYNITHPAEYYKNMNMTLAGLVSTAANPDRALKNAWDAAKGDPAEFLGRLVPELIGTKGAGSVKTLATAAKHLDDFKGPARTRNTVDGPHMSETPDLAKRYENTDPIDLATGRMFLPQTDIVLPGTLPLAFVRRAESGYTGGRWFGPTWTSTVDQHVEVDAEGVVLVTEDGLTVAYPHPAPGVPVLPLSASAPRHPLERTPDGDWTLTDPDTGHVRRFVLPAARLDDNGIAPIAQLEDRNGNLVTFEYDEEGIPLGMSHSAGYRLRFDTADGRVTALHLDAGPRILAYDYTDGNLTGVVNSSGLPLRFTYDERARITSWTDTNNRSYTYEYDELNRCIAEGGSEGHMALRLSYDGIDPGSGHRVTEAVTGEGSVRRYLVDDRYRIVADVDPLGHTTRYVRDTHSRLLAQADPLGRTTTYNYDEHGRPISVIRPDGRGTTVRYNELGLPVHVKRADGQVVRHDYDECGNRVSTTDSLGRITAVTHDDVGGLASVIDPSGQTTFIRCDRAGLPVEVTDPLGATTRFERDAFGRPVAITDQAGATTRLQWTVEGRLARRTHADGAVESWDWDGEGNCTSHTDRLGGVTRFEYGEFDVLTARTGPDGVRYAFRHDADLRLTEVANPQGLTWGYTYDPAGRIISETDFDDRTITYTYQPTGTIASRTNALGQTTSFDRNELDQIVRKDADGNVTTYAYDLTDQLAQAQGPDGTTVTLLRDREGRLLSETVDGRTLAYAYDDLGRRTSRTTPTGATTTGTFDPAGRRTQVMVSGRSLDFTYDSMGREVGRRIGDFLVLSHVYDPAGRLTAQTVTGETGARVRHRDYGYRGDGHLTSVHDADSGLREYELDPAGRVTAVRADSWSETYAYDQAGNQSFASWPADHPGQEANGARTYEGNRIVRAGGVRYEHDRLGRVTVRRKTRLSRKPDVWRYEWDAEDRLVSTTTPDGVVWRYLYDPLGRRTAKLRLADSGSVAERIDFTWDGNTLCEQVSSSSGHPHLVAVTWDHQGIRPMAQTERILDASRDEVDSRFFAIVTDLVGTPTELVDESGNVAWHMRSTLWGLTTWATNSTAYTALRFPGQYADPETGLHYNYFRHYDPETARYLTSDPLGLAPAPNPFAYVPNPQAWTDHLGLAPDYIPIYRVPKGAHAQYELDNGPNPANHQAGVDIGAGVISDGKIYFGEKAVAREYAGPTGVNFAKGMVEYQMHPKFLEEFVDYVKVHDKKGPNGSVRLEFEIPVEKLDRFNELTQRRTWINIFGGPS
ncbi:putative T7SS-secreted protein [Streptomyces virginiae]|uniref:putative T7SS-secreted protein n=1 Tax=Streptomyces virginiae TaxID=1961 RepID=UPI0037A96D91